MLEVDGSSHYANSLSGGPSGVTSHDVLVTTARDVIEW